MHIADYLSYITNKMLQCELNLKAMSYPHCFGTDLCEIYIVLVQCAICEKSLSSFPCSSKIFLNLGSQEEKDSSAFLP